MILFLRHAVLSLAGTLLLFPLASQTPRATSQLLYPAGQPGLGIPLLYNSAVLPNGDALLPLVYSPSTNSGVTLVRVAADRKNIRWARSFPGLGHNGGVTALPDGSVALGVSRSNTSPTAFLTAGIVNLDAGSGAVRWALTLDTLMYNSRITRLNAVHDGVIVFGRLDSTSSPIDAQHPYVVKIDTAGAVQWRKFLPLVQGLVVNVAEDPLTQVLHLASFDNGSLYWTRLAANGDYLGTRRYAGNSSANLGQVYARRGPTGYFAADQFRLSDGAPAQIRLLHLDEAGDVVWARAIGQNAQLNPTALAPTADGGVLVAGYDEQSSYHPGVLVRLDAAGDLRWAYRYSDLWSRFAGITELPDGRISLEGNLIYGFTFNASPRPWCLLVDADGTTPGCCVARAKDVTVTPLNVDPLPDTFVVRPANMLYPLAATSFPVSFELADQCITRDVAIDLRPGDICFEHCTVPVATGDTAGLDFTWQFPGGLPDTATGSAPGAICYPAAGLYPVVLQSLLDGCPLTQTMDTMFVRPEYEIANAFTPNGDDLNDHFKPILPCPVTDYRLEVFSRWGERVFTTTDPEESWTGRTANHEAPADVYFWKLAYRRFSLNNTTVAVNRAGEVTLLR